MEKSTERVIIVIAILVVVFIISMIGFSAYIAYSVSKWQPMIQDAIESGDVLRCNNLPERGALGIGNRDTCIYSVARKNLDPELCKLISKNAIYPMSSDRCIYELAYISKDYESCEMITDQDIRTQCKWSIIKQENAS